MSAVFCVGCGRSMSDCAGCQRPLDPARFCPQCGGRLLVHVTPTGVRAKCRRHGELLSPSDLRDPK